jgi:AcrR family transcriptional regulator
MAKTTSATPSSRGPGRPREFDIDDALDKAIVVFSEFGLHGTSLARLTGAIGVAEGSMYKAFKDKNAMFLAAFRRYVETRNVRLLQEVERAQNGRERVRAILSLYAEYSHGREGRNGCMVVRSAVDLASFDSEMAEFVSTALQAHEVRLVDFIRQGQADGSVGAEVNANAAARVLLCVLEGMRVVAKAGRSRDDMLEVVDCAMKLLD